MLDVAFRLVLASAALLGPLFAQELPPPEVVPASEKVPVEYAVQLPAGFAAAQFRPVVLLCGEVTTNAAVDRQRALALAKDLAAKGMVVAVPQLGGLDACSPGGGVIVFDHPGLPSLTVAVRRRFHIAGGGMHLVGLGNAVRVTELLANKAPWQFQSLTLVGEKLVLLPQDLGSFWARPCTVFGAGSGDSASYESLLSPEELRKWRAEMAAVVANHPAVPPEQLPATLAEHLLALQAARTPTGVAGEVAAALDDFHDAADKGDVDRYFARFPDDAVFLGTDPTERWVGPGFRKFAEPYFRRGSGWTFVPVVRHVDVAASGTFAWFHERLDNEPYGECRGSGVLEKRGGTWVVRQYDLTIPVPNDLANGVVARIRAARRGLPAPLGTVVLVRHAEKGTGTDPYLTDAGRARAARLAAALADLPIASVYTSEYKRTQATVAPLCAAKGLTAKTVAAADRKALLAEINPQNLCGTVLIAGHSDTIPGLLKALGVAEPVTIADDDFGELLVVALSPDGARLLRLHY